MALLTAIVFGLHSTLTLEPLSLKYQLSTGFVENLGVKDKESLEGNGLSPCRERSAGFRVEISSENREADSAHPLGDREEIY